MINALPEDKNRIADILTAAFLDNKSVNYLVPQDGLKLYRIHQLMFYAFEICIQFGKVYLSDDRNACALILYPELKRTTFRSVWLDLKLIFKAIGFNNALKAMKRENKIKALQPSERKAYLWFIGVDPKYQKLGQGKKLMEEIIIACKLEERPIYLETSNLTNLPWYKKFGFEIYDELIFDYALYFLKHPL